MELLQQAYEKALLQNEEMIEKWKRCISEYICVKERLDTFRSELSLKIMVPLGPKALMRGKLYHTNEILIHLGNGWFSRRSAHQALDICNRRIKNAEVMMKEFEQERVWLMNKRDMPKEMDIFVDKNQQEIIEDYDEEKEKEWRARHRMKVKEYHQQLAKQRQMDLNSENDDEYWQKLEELELQEELERELEYTNDSSRTADSLDFIKNYDKSYSKNMSNIVCDTICANVSVKDDKLSHQTDEISDVVLLERKSKICDNLPLNMKLSYDFIGAFEDYNTENRIGEISNNETAKNEEDVDENNRVILENDEIKSKFIENSQTISNVKLLNRESNLNNDIKINIRFGEKSLEMTSNRDNSLEIISSNSRGKDNYQNQSEEIKHETMDNNENKTKLLENYKLKLIELRKQIDGTVIKTHDELCKQLDKYDLKEELEHKILLLQDELNIENDDILNSDSSEENVYKTNLVPSEKSLKRVSFTEKDHTKYLDDNTPDPPLILHFRHSATIPYILESNDENNINGPQDIYKFFKNCFVQNSKPYKSILKKTTSSIIKPYDEVPYNAEPGFGDTAKVLTQKQDKPCPVVIGDVFEHKATSGIIESNTKDIDEVVQGPISRFKSKRQSFK